MTENFRPRTAPSPSLDPVSRLTADATAAQVGAMILQARPRFARDGHWTIDALELESIGAESRQRLEDGLHEFRSAGGTLVILITVRPRVATSFLVMGIRTGTLKLMVVRNQAEALASSAKHRAQENGDARTDR